MYRLEFTFNKVGDHEILGKELARNGYEFEVHKFKLHKPILGNTAQFSVGIDACKLVVNLVDASSRDNVLSLNVVDAAVTIIKGDSKSIQKPQVKDEPTATTHRECTEEQLAQMKQELEGRRQRWSLLGSSPTHTEFYKINGVEWAVAGAICQSCGDPDQLFFVTLGEDSQLLLCNSCIMYHQASGQDCERVERWENAPKYRVGSGQSVRERQNRMRNFRKLDPEGVLILNDHEKMTPVLSKMEFDPLQRS